MNNPIPIPIPTAQIPLEIKTSTEPDQDLESLAVLPKNKQQRYLPKCHCLEALFG